MKKILLLIFGIFIFDTSFNFAFARYNSCEEIRKYYQGIFPNMSVFEFKILPDDNCADREFIVGSGYNPICIPWCNSCNGQKPGYTLRNISCQQKSDGDVVCNDVNQTVVYSGGTTNPASSVGTTWNVKACVEDPDAPCPSGYYGTSGKNCYLCPENATCPGGKNSTFNCNKGFYKNNSQNGCTSCPTGTTTETTGAGSIIDCTAMEGYYGRGGGVKKCPDNSTSKAGSLSLWDCHCYQNFYADFLSSNPKCLSCENGYTDSSGATDISACKCKAGYYKSGTKCQQCPNFDSINTGKATSPAGATSVSQCYIAKDTSIEDTTGYFHFSGNCQYKQ